VAVRTARTERDDKREGKTRKRRNCSIIRVDNLLLIVVAVSPNHCSDLSITVMWLRSWTWTNVAINTAMGRDCRQQPIEPDLRPNVGLTISEFLVSNKPTELWNHSA